MMFALSRCYGIVPIVAMATVLTACGGSKSSVGEVRTISDGNSSRTESPYKPCFPTKEELEKWLTFSVDAGGSAKYDYIEKNDPYTLSPGDKVRIVEADYASFQDGQTPIRLYIIPDKRMPFPGDGQTCFASDDGVLFASE